MSHLEGPYLRFSEISNSSNSAFFSETDFLIIRTSGSIFIFYLFELIGNLPYTLPLQTVQLQISWLLKKPTDLDLHCLSFSM